MKQDELIRELPKGIWNWYEFRAGSRVLFVGEKDDPLAELLVDMKLKVHCATLEELFTAASGDLHFFDYIVGLRMLEQCGQRVRLLQLCKSLLNEQGVLLLGEENRFGLRYFCGEKEPHTGRSFDGIENYRTEGFKLTEEKTQQDARLFARFELEEMLQNTGFFYRRFFSVLSSLEFPQMIYAEDYLPEEEMAIRYTPFYNHPETLFLEESYLYDDLIKNGMFHQMANAYLIECPIDGVFSDVKHVTISMDRGRERAFTTIILNDGKVIKRAVYKEGRTALTSLCNNMQDLEEHGIKVVQGTLQEAGYVMPYVKAENGVNYFRRLLFEDKDKFIAQVDKFCQCVLKSSEEADIDDADVEKLNIPGISSKRDKDLGKYYKRVYIDMVPLNCWVENDEFIFFDQEFCMENYPVNVTLHRMLNIIYQADARMQAILPMSYFMKRYGMEGKENIYARLNTRFMAELRKRNQLMDYNERHHAKGEIIYRNRQQMNYTFEEYQQLFIDIFENTVGKQLFLFGSGSYAVFFMEWFGDSIHLDGILDNNSERWGQCMNEIPIKSPQILKQMEPDSYKVIICVKKYMPIMCQLKELGTKYISIYDAYIDYPRNRSVDIVAEKTIPVRNDLPNEGVKKRYHVGYVSGVFDLFHIGHLNLFKRAKEQCDYLIVGVVMDEGVRNNKNKDPYVPFDERIELVRSCKYVDEAVKIPLHSAGPRDAYRRYHFDCQFSGSDYVNDPYWLEEQAYLRSRGSDLVFFPYTEQTSSTKLRKIIENRRPT